MKKVMTLILSIALCFSCIACNSNDKDNTTTTNNKEIVEKDNKNSENKNKDNNKDISAKSDNNNNESSSSNNSNNISVSSNDQNNTNTSSEDSSETSNSKDDSYEDVTNENKSKITGTWNDKDSSDVYIFNDDESYSCKSDILNQEGEYWFMTSNNQLYLYIYAKGTAHPSYYGVNFKDANTVELIDPTDSTNVLVLLRQ